MLWWNQPDVLGYSRAFWSEDALQVTCTRKTAEKAKIVISDGVEWVRWATNQRGKPINA